MTAVSVNNSVPLCSALGVKAEKQRCHWQVGVRTTVAAEVLGLAGRCPNTVAAEVLGR